MLSGWEHFVFWVLWLVNLSTLSLGHLIYNIISVVGCKNWHLLASYNLTLKLQYSLFLIWKGLKRIRVCYMWTLIRYSGYWDQVHLQTVVSWSVSLQSVSCTALVLVVTCSWFLCSWIQHCFGPWKNESTPEHRGNIYGFLPRKRQN